MTVHMLQATRTYLIVCFESKESNRISINEVEIFKVGLAVVFAGADSTGALLAAVLYYLMENLPKCVKPRKELDRKL